MNLPNKLTVLRVIMVPFFVFFMLTGVGGAANKWIALIIFCVASLTDMLDGKIARARNLVTNFGKFMDPLADETACMFGYDLHDPAWKTAGMVCDRYYCKRVYHQRFPSGSSRQRYCDRCKLLGKIQNGIPDVHADPSDRRSWRCI